VQAAFALVGAADARLDHAIIEEGAQDAVQALLGDPENRQKL